MEWLKNKWVQFYLWCHPQLKRVRLEVLAWSTEASVKPVSLYHDAMLSRGSGLSLYLLPLVLRSKQHLFNNRWATTEAPMPVGRIFMDHIDWVYIEKDLHPENVYYDLVNRIKNDALVMVIEIGEEDPRTLIEFLYNNSTVLLHYPVLGMATINQEFLTIGRNKSSLRLHTVFNEMYTHHFMEHEPPVQYLSLEIFRHDGMLFILFDS